MGVMEFVSILKSIWLFVYAEEENDSQLIAYIFIYNRMSLACCMTSLVLPS
jgi:hypothetical protein